MSEQEFEDFESFWAHYVAEHSNPTTRLLHAVGTTGALATALAALLKRKPKWLALVPLLGYGPAWAGHYFVEGNKPATLDHPVWSLRADLRMYKMMLNGEMEEEMYRLIGDGEYAPKLLEEL